MSSNPQCPHCDYELDDEETWYGGDILAGDGDESEVECPNKDCGKKYEVRCSALISFEVIER
ncbi:hypothetical protein KAR91_17085 [Candidatus Pacearchaeota archaeon]|nr:hypothetical protein [Candidatus Pacearchaeota archaeon]